MVSVSLIAFGVRGLMVRIPGLRLAMFLCHLGAHVSAARLLVSRSYALSSYYSAQGGIYEAFFFFF